MKSLFVGILLVAGILAYTSYRSSHTPYEKNKALYFECQSLWSGQNDKPLELTERRLKDIASATTDSDLAFLARLYASEAAQYQRDGFKSVKDATNRSTFGRVTRRLWSRTKNPAG
jgi:hypothetical protein